MLFIILISFLLLFILILLGRTLVLRKKPTISDNHVVTSEMPQAVDILTKAIACKTVSYADPSRTDWSQFSLLIDVIQTSFPSCAAHRIESKEIGPYNLVYRFQGTEESKLPALLTAHYDVVNAKEDQWSYPPFQGTVVDDYLYGRGSFDCKLQVVSILSAFEQILQSGESLKHTWYVAFGCDEESNSSTEGASRIVSYFEMQNLSFSFVLDEGGVVSENYIKGFDQSIAVVGIGEKGYLDMELSVKKVAGHSSTPTFPTALGVLSKAVSRLEQSQMPPTITYPVKQMLTNLGKEGPLPYSLLFLNLWATKPLLKSIFTKSSTLNALIRTTVVPTVISASDKSNVIAQQAVAQVNARVLPGQGEREVISWVKQTIKEDEVQVKSLRYNAPSKVSSVECNEFSFISNTIRTIFPDALVTPYLMLGATDARKYERLSKNIFRFTPARMTKDEVDRMHAPDERISLDNIRKAQQFYQTLLKTW